MDSMKKLPKFRESVCLILFICLLTAWPFAAKGDSTAQDVDEEYTRLIHEATTKPEFLSPLTDYLPKAEGIPTPKDVLGYIAGAPGKLTYYDDIRNHALQN